MTTEPTPDMSEKEEVFVEEVVEEHQEVTSTSFKRASEIKDKAELARWRKDVAQHLAGRGQFVIEAEKVQGDTPRYCMDCCTIFLTVREFNRHGDLHGCKHECESRKVCEARLAEFQRLYPLGRII